MNIPTKLTVLRIILVPVFLLFVFLDIPALHGYNNFIALFVFCLASFTDFLDGYLARKWKQVTDLGKLLDSTADKMLVGAALIAEVYSAAMMCMSGLVDIAFVVCICLITIVIVCREFFISIFRAMAAAKGIIIAADMAGKIKTVVQMIGLILLIGVPDIFIFSKTTGAIIFYIGFGILAVGALLAISSCINYIMKNPGVMREDKLNEVQKNSDI